MNPLQAADMLGEVAVERFRVGGPDGGGQVRGSRCSVIHADAFTDPPHFAAKAAAERMITDAGPPATILRPGVYMQTETQWRGALDNGFFSSPVGDKDVLATDTRDLAEVAARALVNRLRPGAATGIETLDVVAPEVLTGNTIARIWSEALGRPIVYADDDLDAFEQQMRQFMPAWHALDLRLMFRRFQADGMQAAPGTDQRLRELLGRPMRSYREFAAETAASWAS